MKNAYVNLVLAAVAAAPALAQQAAWAQCGGSGWTGGTSCVSGYTCKSSNEYYSQCVPGSSSDSGSGTAPSTGNTGSGSADAAPWWVGINLSGAEFGDGKYPGIYNKDYTWYSNSAIDQFISKGFNLFRINFSMERLTPTITGSFDAGYLGNLTATINYITGKGAYAMIQPHNYGRFNGAIITDTNAFKTWWQNVASQYKSNNLVVFDTNNEYHDMDQSLVVNLNQAAINGIRAAGATSQWITPEGNSWTGAWTWTSVNGATMGALTDPQNKLIYQMHQYLDTDGSGTHAECVSTTIFQERLTSATQWLKQNSKKGFIGEFAGGNNTQCITALNQGLQYLKANKDVWTGSAWWAAGPWWGDYMYSMEPPSGTAWSVVLPKIQANLK